MFTVPTSQAGLYTPRALPDATTAAAANAAAAMQTPLRRRSLPHLAHTPQSGGSGSGSMPPPTFLSPGAAIPNIRPPSEPHPGASAPMVGFDLTRMVPSSATTAAAPSKAKPKPKAKPNRRRNSAGAKRAAGTGRKAGRGSRGGGRGSRGGRGRGRARRKTDAGAGARGNNQGAKPDVLADGLFPPSNGSSGMPPSNLPLGGLFSQLTDTPGSGLSFGAGAFPTPPLSGLDDGVSLGTGNLLSGLTQSPGDAMHPQMSPHTLSQLLGSPSSPGKMMMDEPSPFTALHSDLGFQPDILADTPTDDRPASSGGPRRGRGGTNHHDQVLAWASPGLTPTDTRPRTAGASGQRGARGSGHGAHAGSSGRDDAVSAPPQLARNNTGDYMSQRLVHMSITDPAEDGAMDASMRSASTYTGGGGGNTHAHAHAHAHARAGGRGQSALAVPFHIAASGAASSHAHTAASTGGVARPVLDMTTSSNVPMMMMTGTMDASLAHDGTRTPARSLNLEELDMLEALANATPSTAPSPSGGGFAPWASPTGTSARRPAPAFDMDATAAAVSNAQHGAGSTPGEQPPEEWLKFLVASPGRSSQRSGRGAPRTEMDAKELDALLR